MQARLPSDRTIRPLNARFVGGSAHLAGTFLAIVSVVVLALLPLATAAPPGGGGAVSGGPINAIANIKGTLTGATPAGISVEGDDGTQYMVAFPDDPTSMTLVAKVDAAMLRPGQMVRVRVDYAAGGTQTAPANKVELIHSVPPTVVRGHKSAMYKPGVNPVDRKLKVGQPGKYYVVGNVAGGSGNRIMVRAGKMPLQIVVGDTPQYEIRYHNLSLAQPGDPVEVAGFYNPANPNMVKADTIKITPTRDLSAAPATNAGGESRRAARKRAKAERSDKNDDSGDKSGNDPDMDTNAGDKPKDDPKR